VVAQLRKESERTKELVNLPFVEKHSEETTAHRLE
jgi:hypothetical protein